jgi:hypothetical protein
MHVHVGTMANTTNEFSKILNSKKFLKNSQVGPSVLAELSSRDVSSTCHVR